jgi:hypothetical protein
MAKMYMTFKSGSNEVSFFEIVGDGSRDVDLRIVYENSVITRTILLRKEDVENLVAFLTATPPKTEKKKA